MFQDYLVPEYSRDINDEMIESVKNKGKPILVFGCGGSGEKVSVMIEKRGLSIDAYCEGSQFWYEGKKFRKKRVIRIDMIASFFDEACIVIAATGPEIIEYVNELKNQGGYDVYSFVDREQMYSMDSEWVFEHKEELSRTYNLLEDDFSKKTFLSYLGARANCIKRENTVQLLDLWKTNQYFNELYPKDRYDEHILIDCGAWIGDSAEGFIDFMKDTSKPVTVRAFEMEEENYRILKSVAEKYNNIVCYNYGVGDKHETVYFEKNSDASIIVDHVTDYSVDIFPVDEILCGESAKATFVKMDLEGYERYALKGMKELIKNNLPMLAICVYHRIDDLITIPHMICNMEAESELKDIQYKFYLRHHSHNAAELVFYAVPSLKS